MANWRYCIEHDTDGKLVYQMGDNKDAMAKYCEEQSKTMGSNESYVLFRCQVGEDGKFSGGPQQIIQTWLPKEE